MKIHKLISLEGTGSGGILSRQKPSQKMRLQRGRRFFLLQG